MNLSLNLWGAWLGRGVGGDWGGRWWLGDGGGHFYWYVARGFKKVPAIYGDFDFFFPQKTTDFENSS